MLEYKEEKIFTKEQVQDLFLSGGWGSGNYAESSAYMLCGG